MADDADLAQARAELEEQLLLAAFRAAAPARQTGRACVACGDEIPAPRRAAMPGCRLCLCCQNQQERIGCR